MAETIDWATALTELDARSLTPQVVGDTLGALLKYQDDIARMQGDTLQKVLKEATAARTSSRVTDARRFRGDVQQSHVRPAMRSQIAVIRRIFRVHAPRAPE